MSYAEEAKAANTRLAYRSDWRSFEPWCDAQELPTLPAAAETVVLHLAARAEAGLKASSLTRALTAIVQAHLAASLPSPRSAAVRAVLQGICRRHGTAPVQKSPLGPRGAAGARGATPGARCVPGS
jgi:hypothetical protein